MFTLVAAALPRKKRPLQGRRLAVVEIENIGGGIVRTSAHALWERRRIVEAVDLQHDEQVIVGACHPSVIAVGDAWPGARLVASPRTDGVQRELLEILQGERIAERFDELILASGNGIFADAVAHLGAEGVKVTVVAWPESLSRRLRMAASRTVYLAQAASGGGGAA